MTDSTLQVLNKHTLVSLIGDDTAMIKKFETDFIKQAKTSLKEISQLYNAGELKPIKEVAHFLKTSAKAVGAEVTADYLQQLENSALALEKNKCRLLIIEISNSVKAVYKEMVYER